MDKNIVYFLTACIFAVVTINGDSNVKSTVAPEKSTTKIHNDSDILLNVENKITLTNPSVLIKPSSKSSVVGRKGVSWEENIKSTDNVNFKNNNTDTISLNKIDKILEKTVTSLENPLSTSTNSNDIIFSTESSVKKNHEVIAPMSSTVTSIPSVSASSSSLSSSIASTTIKATLVYSSTTTATTTTTTTKPTTKKPKKPTVTKSLGSDSNIESKSIPIGNKDEPKIKGKEDEEPNVEPSIEYIPKTKKRDYIVPIVVILFTIFIIFGITTVVFRRIKDYWMTRHYRRMDFLVDEMYND